MDLVVYFQDMWRFAVEGQAQGVWFWAAFYTFIVCLWSLIFQLRTRYWPCTPGELAEIGARKFGATDRVKSDQDYVTNALYKYHVSGVDYTGTRISPWIIVASHNARFVLQKQLSFIQRYPDGRVKVFYNPANPRKSYLIIAGKPGICITLLLVTLPMVSYYFSYHG